MYLNVAECGQKSVVVDRLRRRAPSDAGAQRVLDAVAEDLERNALEGDGHTVNVSLMVNVSYTAKPYVA